jgi:hypothetical protein
MSHGLPLMSLTMSQNKQYYEHQYAGRIIQSTFITHFTMQQCIINCYVCNGQTLSDGLHVLFRLCISGIVKHDRH